MTTSSHHPQLTVFFTLSLLGGFFSAVPANAQEEAAITFNAHIAPIIYNNCTICHREGEIGPMPLTSYAEVSAFAETIAHVTAEEIMPPWPPDPSFSRFVGERRLTGDQIDLIAQWAAAGSPEGDPEAAPSLPDFPEGSVLGEPDLTLTMSEAYTIKGDNLDEYRVFVLPTGLTEDKDLVAVEFRPGNPKIVHHALLSIDSTGEARRLDAQDAPVGYPSFGGFGVPARQGLAYPGWVPGATPRFFPAGTGLKLPAGADVLVQIHYAPWPVKDSDQSSVNLFFTEKPVEREIQTRVMLPSDLVDEQDEYYKLSPILGAVAGPVIANGVQEFLGETITAAQVDELARNATLDTVFGDQLGGTVAGFLTFTIPEETRQHFRGIWEITKDISLLNVWPHMHYLGNDWEIVLQRPDGSTENLIRIGDWDFNWQGSYTFPRYIKVPAGSRILAAATYDNTSTNSANPNFPPKEVDWGQNTTDEMYFLPFGYVDYQEGDELLSLDQFSPGDLPAFRVGTLTDQTIEFRLQAGERSFTVEHSQDMMLWQRVAVDEVVPEGEDWHRLTLSRGQESAGFYRAVIFE
jgi:hypothetical protein